MKIVKNSLCPLFIGLNILEKAVAEYIQSKSRIALIYDATLAEWAEALEAMIIKRNISVNLIAVPSGEDSKCRAMKAQIEDTMLDEGYDRKSLIIALGGGVITDLAGFVAATYLRGVSFLSIPTTILAMVDAAIGGKTGINTVHGKNLIGAYYIPQAIIIDYSFLSTLPFPVYRAGFSEILKYGCILNRELFHTLEKSDAFYEKSAPFIETCIEESIHAKLSVVTADPKESGYRRILNFGHTIGHGIELLSHYQIAHGDAVAMGMVGEAYLSYLEGYLAEQEWKQIRDCIMCYQFPFFSLEKISFSQFLDAMMRDKKNEKNKPRYVLLESIGKAHPFGGEYCTVVDENHLEQTFTYLKDLL